LLNKPVEVRVSEGEATGDHIQQDIVRVGASENKFDVLLSMLAKSDFDKVLLFAETKRTVDRMTKMLKKSGLQVEQIHGNKSQNARQTALTKFKSGKIQVLVATDVAARGIDVSDVTHVINYQIPQTYDSYVHRIGRTGRAGKTGKAFTFVD
jgi:ATP-dependent RNA helicase RhlE